MSASSFDVSKGCSRTTRVRSKVAPFLLRRVLTFRRYAETWRPFYERVEQLRAEERQRQRDLQNPSVSLQTSELWLAWVEMAPWFRSADSLARVRRSPLFAILGSTCVDILRQLSGCFNFAFL